MWDKALKRMAILIPLKANNKSDKIGIHVVNEDKLVLYLVGSSLTTAEEVR